MNLEHTAINVEAPAEMAAWWAKNLGMRIVMAQDVEPYMHFIADDKGSMIELYNNPAAPIPDYAGMAPFTLHLAFSTDDIEGERDRLLAAGATLDTDVADTPAGDKLVFLRDPWNGMK